MHKQMKTVKQYSPPLAADKLNMLHAVAKDYMAIKNYVYERYSGVGSLSKIDPGYTVQNEMTASGLRKRLDITSVYFYRAIFDALQDIKMQWQRLRDKTRLLVMRNPNLSGLERQYVCWILKHPKLYTRVLQRKRVDLPPNFQNRLDNAGRLHNLICRLARRHKEAKCHAHRWDSFSITNRAYQYVPGGIKISTKTPNRRVFIPLTDKNRYDMQLLLKFDRNGRIVLHVPLQQKTRQNTGFSNQLELRFGYGSMLHLPDGQVYGGRLGEYMTQETKRLNQKNKRRQELVSQSRLCVKQGEGSKAQRIVQNNLGQQKYLRQKHRADEAVKSYINGQLNEMIQREKPGVIVIPKRGKIAYKQVPYELRAYLSRWLLGYIRRRLEYKCVQNNIGLVEMEMDNGYIYEEFKKKADVLYSCMVKSAG